MFEKKLKVVSSMNLPRGRYGAPMNVRSLKIPTLTCRDTAVCATPRRVYANAHAYHVNSISPCSDGETFLSADDLRINLWNMNNSQISFNIVDIKPENMEELTEVITASCFHPKSCNLFIYSSSRGAIKLADMRSAALCDSHSKGTCRRMKADLASARHFTPRPLASALCLVSRSLVCRRYLSF